VIKGPDQATKAEVQSTPLNKLPVVNKAHVEAAAEFEDTNNPSNQRNPAPADLASSDPERE